MTAALTLAQVAERLRIPLSEVAVMAGLSPVTIKRRVKANRFPAPVDRGAQLLFDRDQIVNFLKRVEDKAAAHGPQW